MTVVAGRSRIATTLGIVAASQPLAARAGVQILERGGTASDAAIAANAVLGVVEPEMNGIGGDLFAIIYEAKTDRAYGLNASGWSPSGLTPALLRSRGLTSMPSTGVYTVTVPGCVAGWEALQSRFGTLGLADVLAPAVFYAEEGFPVSDIIAARWAACADMLAADASASATFLVDGRAPRAGEIFANRSLARTLRIIAADGARAFYRGPIADAIVDTLRARGGTMTSADLAELRADWVAPVSTTYHGWQVFELPPNTQGLAALLMLDIMEQFPLREYGIHSARALHVMIEAKKLAYADMLRYAADPRFAPAPLGALIDKDYAKSRAALVDPQRAAANVEPTVFEGMTTSPRAASRGDTVYLSAIDRDGNIVSLIQSTFHGFGSGICAAESGFMLQNRGALFTLDPDHPNVLAPRKRPLHTIIPGYMQKDGVRIGFGIMGAWNQAQAHAQFVANVVDFDLDIQHALEAGRFTKPTFDGTDVLLEQLIPDRTRAELAALGHVVTVVPPRTGVFGSGQAVMSDANGVHYGASEPRHDGAAIPEAPPFQSLG
jgi:gamma-glutamyltranspeptidase/glutathione hydrolase